MTNPRDPYGNGSSDDFNSRDENSVGDNSASSGGNHRRDSGDSSNLPRYESTSHPEDRPDYGQGSSAFPAYGDYQSANGEAGYANAQTPLSGAAPTQQGTGKIDLMAAIKWGFKATFSNAKLWILGAVAYLGLAILIGIAAAAVDMSGVGSAGANAVSYLLGLILLVLNPFILRLALHEIDSPRNGWSNFNRDLNYWPTLLVAIIVNVVTGVIFSLLSLAFMLPQMEQLEQLATTESVSVDESLALLGKLFTYIGIMLVVSLLVTPLHQLMVWFAADRQAGVGGSIVRGFKAGAANYLPLMGYNLLIGLAAIIGVVITFGLALIPIMPASLLIVAHMYRQASGGRVPADS